MSMPVNHVHTPAAGMRVQRNVANISAEFMSMRRNIIMGMFITRRCLTIRMEMSDNTDDDRLITAGVSMLGNGANGALGIGASGRIVFVRCNRNVNRPVSVHMIGNVNYNRALGVSPRGITMTVGINVNRYFAISSVIMSMRRNDSNIISGTSPTAVMCMRYRRHINYVSRAVLMWGHGNDGAVVVVPLMSMQHDFRADIRVGVQFCDYPVCPMCMLPVFKRRACKISFPVPGVRGSITRDG
jgi:hypothetical protein